MAGASVRTINVILSCCFRGHIPEPIPVSVSGSRIHCHKQVVSVYLMSGSFDFTVIINGRSLQEVSRFVSENLAPMENIISTSTHFVLKKYKDAGIDFNPVDEREDFRDD